MAKFKYVGDPNDGFGGPQVTTQSGISFVKGEVVDVPDKSDEEKATVKKLQGNSHFVDLSDKETVSDVAERQKALEDAEKSKAKAAEDQRKRDETDKKQMLANQAKDQQKRGPGRPRLSAENAPRPPGKVTRPPVAEPFGGRTVEERTATEDHTRSGKTKS